MEGGGAFTGHRFALVVVEEEINLGPKSLVERVKKTSHVPAIVARAGELSDAP